MDVVVLYNASKHRKKGYPEENVMYRDDWPDPPDQLSTRNHTQVAG